MLFILTLMIIFSLIVEYLRNNKNSFSNWFNFLFGFMLRNDESTGKITGATYLLIGFTITVALFDMSIAVVALLLVSVGDSFAAIAGKIYPKIQIGSKTLSGSLFGFFTSFLFAIFIEQSLRPSIILLGSVVAMIVEIIPSKLNDNITIPIFSGAAMMFADNIL